MTMPDHRKKKRKVSEKIARPTRTTIQAVIAEAIVLWVNSHVHHLDRNQKALAVLIALALVNAAWVQIEDRTGYALLRTVPPRKANLISKDNDVPAGEVGAGELGLVIGVLLVVILVVVLLRVL